MALMLPTEENKKNNTVSRGGGKGPACGGAGLYYSPALRDYANETPTPNKPPDFRGPEDPAGYFGHSNANNSSAVR